MLSEQGSPYKGASGGTPCTSPDLVVYAFRADYDVLVVRGAYAEVPVVLVPVERGTQGAEPACRCYRCGVLLTAATLGEMPALSTEGVFITLPVCGSCPVEIELEARC